MSYGCHREWRVRRDSRSRVGCVTDWDRRRGLDVQQPRTLDAADWRLGGTERCQIAGHWTERNASEHGARVFIGHLHCHRHTRITAAPPDSQRSVQWLRQDSTDGTPERIDTPLIDREWGARKHFDAEFRYLLTLNEVHLQHFVLMPTSYMIFFSYSYLIWNIFLTFRRGHGLLASPEYATLCGSVRYKCGVGGLTLISFLFHFALLSDTLLFRIREHLNLCGPFRLNSLDSGHCSIRP